VRILRAALDDLERELAPPGAAPASAPPARRETRA